MTNNIYKAFSNEGLLKEIGPFRVKNSDASISGYKSTSPVMKKPTFVRDKKVGAESKKTNFSKNLS